MRQLKPLFLLAGLIAAVVLWQRPAPAPPPGLTSPTTSAPSRQDTPSLPAFLPPGAQVALDRIARGGPFSHRQDGMVFGNYEGLLPKQPRGYYHEYTVETPGAGTRGARRIITGGTPPQVWYYTDDHYRSFRRFEMNR
ncbi:MAG: ribonuclease [Rhodanobacter sp.]|jgi:guanyl-specific ribonuclease Sa|nr:ribonuclease [Rhodanobacter sp.]